MTTRINRRDLPWVAFISVSFIFALVISWQRWGNPLVDCGREMNQPLRLERGEMLYSEVRHIYGPLSPYVNAGLYSIFSPSLSVLYADGIVTAMIIIAMIYWISRQLMGRAASTAATLSVMWLCAFKQAGNYILPYSYSALHGCALGLVTLALIVKSVSGRKKAEVEKQKAADSSLAAFCLLPSAFYLMAAGVMAGLTTLAKTEMGMAALLAGAVTAALAGCPSLRRALLQVTLFVGPALAIVLAVYGYFSYRVGWDALSKDSFLFLQNLPPELVYFNKKMSGFDEPLQSFVQMLGVAFRILTLAAIIATVSLLISRRTGQSSSSAVGVGDRRLIDAGQVTYPQLWALLAGSLLLFIVVPLAWSIQWDKGPYLAMPVVLAGVLVVAFIGYQKEVSLKGQPSRRTLVLLAISIYALACLARVMLRVRSGGAYSSYLLPASVVLFTYGWAYMFANMLRPNRARRLARNIAVGLILIDAVATSGLLAYRYRTRNTYPVVTSRGTIVAIPDLGQAVDEAINFIKRETAPGDSIAVMPEGTSLNFFTDRRNPLREEITTPGFLDSEGEERAIRQLIESDTRLIMVTNRPTVEFGPIVFGRDYCQRLMQWVEENYELIAVFGPDHNPALQIGDRTFFIRAYRRRDQASGNTPN